MPIFNNSSSAIRSSPPGRVVPCHLDNELSEFGGNPRSSAWTRFPFPKQTKSFAMPTDQRVGVDDGEGIAPVKQMRQSSHGKADSIGRAARFNFPLDKESELLTQKQILGRDSSRGA
jgi:hypothetical protein